MAPAPSRPGNQTEAGRETGWPTFAKLAELGIEWAAKPGDTW